METSRFSGAEWFDKLKGESVLIGGAGGIGSWFALFLARSHPTINISIVDMDTVENVNLGGQFYSEEDVGKSKVFSVTKNIEMFTNKSILGFHHNIDAFLSHSSTKYFLYVSAFDNVEARRSMFNHFLKEAEERKVIYLDAGLTAEDYQIYFVDGSDEEQVEKYKEHIESDIEYEDLPCSFKSTSHISAKLGATMVEVLNAYISKEEGGYRIPPKRVAHNGSLLLDRIEYE